MKTAFITFFLALFAMTAEAEQLGLITRNTMEGCNCALDGTVRLDANNSAISWDFTDGTHELTQLNSTGIFSQQPHGVQGVGFEFWKFDIVVPMSRCSLSFSDRTQIPRTPALSTTTDFLDFWKGIPASGAKPSCRHQSRERSCCWPAGWRF